MKRIIPVISLMLFACVFCSCNRENNPGFLEVNTFISEECNRYADSYSVKLSETQCTMPKDEITESVTSEPNNSNIKLTAIETFTVYAEQTTDREEKINNSVSHAETTTQNKVKHLSYGTAGRLDIPCVNIGVRIYYVDLTDGNVQSVVDAHDSAAYFLYANRKMVIADHNNQEFSHLSDIHVGDKAVISDADGNKEEYVCTRICYDGHNMGTYLVDEYGIYVENSDDGNLIMYTCNDCWQNVTIVYWQRAE